MFRAVYGAPLPASLPGSPALTRSVKVPPLRSSPLRGGCADPDTPPLRAFFD
jgi:hypothetical protein